jgi:hypothetical protein
VDRILVTGATGRLGGSVVEPVRVDPERARETTGEELAGMYRWYDRVGGRFRADPGRVTRETGVRPHSFGEYVREHGARAGVGERADEAFERPPGESPA